MTVLVAPWPEALGEHVVGGSVYAVDPTNRVEAADRLTEAGCRVHVDVILGLDGRHRGVRLDELAAIRRAVPGARIDVHLIVLGELAVGGPVLAGSGRTTRLAEEPRTIAAAVEVGAELLTVGRGCLSRHADDLAGARTAGTAVWLEVPPEDPGVDADRGDVDGALVMLITPGTRQSADLAHLSKVERLAQHLPVGVDGGITRATAARARDAGASYVVSGRDLLSVTAPDPGRPAERLARHGHR